MASPDLGESEVLQLLANANMSRNKVGQHQHLQCNMSVFCRFATLSSLIYYITSVMSCDEGCGASVASCFASCLRHISEQTNTPKLLVTVKS